MRKSYTHFSIGLFGALSACGPIYDTVYNFTPPDSAVGRNCVESCEDAQSHCKDFENQRQSDCEDMERDRMDLCSQRILDKEHRGPKSTECGRTRSCSANLDRCEGSYRACYQACGGTVTAKQECVAFCPD